MGDYDVQWADATYDVFTDYWFAAVQPDRERAEAAMFTLNKALGDDPFRVGESRETDDERFTYEPPLAVRFSVDEAERVVRVSHLRIHR